MRSYIIKNVSYITIFLSLSSIILGYMSKDCETSHVSHDQKLMSCLSFFFHVSFQNIVFAGVILFGALLFNISTFCLVVYNGYIWGSYFKFNSCFTSLERTISDFLPHTLIELIWILFLSRLSLKLSFLLYDLMNDKIEANVLLAFINESRNKVYISLSLILFGAIIETTVFYFNRGTQAVIF